MTSNAADGESARSAPVDLTVPDGLGQMGGGDLVATGQIRHRAGHAQEAT